MMYKPCNEVIGEISSPAALTRVYKEYVRDGTAKGRDGIHPRQLEGDIQNFSSRLSSKIQSGRFIFTTYKMYLKSKGPKKHPRELSIPTARDRIVLKSIALHLASHLDISNETPQAKVGRVRAALNERRFDSFVRLDITDFYPSIIHDQLRSALRQNIHDDVIALVLAACSTATVTNKSRRPTRRNHKGVPQGLAISNILADAYLRDYDTYMTMDSNLEYFRYCDDILILCHHQEMERVHERAAAALDKIGLRPHEIKADSKSSMDLISAGFDYLGYYFNGTEITVRDSTDIEHHLAKCFTKYKYDLERSSKGTEIDYTVPMERCIMRLEWYLNLRITGCIHEGKSRGWLRYYSMIDDIGLLKSLDVQVMRLVARFGLQEHLIPKTFVRAYWAIKRPNRRRQKYIPNFDDVPIRPEGIDLDSLNTELDNSSKIGILFNIFRLKKRWLLEANDEEIRQCFSERMRQVVKDLEHDITAVS